MDQENIDLRTSAENMEPLAWALLGVGAAVLAASVPLLVLGFRGRPASNTQVSLMPTRDGLFVGGSWSF